MVRKFYKNAPIKVLLNNTNDSLIFGKVTEQNHQLLLLFSSTKAINALADYILKNNNPVSNRVYKKTGYKIMEERLAFISCWR